MGKSVGVLGNVNGDVGSRPCWSYSRKLFESSSGCFYLLRFPSTVLLLIGSQRFVYRGGDFNLGTSRSDLPISAPAIKDSALAKRSARVEANRK